MSGETINAIRVAAREQLHVPLARKQLEEQARDGSLTRASPGSDTYRWGESARFSRLSHYAKMTGASAEAAAERVVMAGLRKHRAWGDVNVDTRDIAITVGLREEEVWSALERLRARWMVERGLSRRGFVWRIKPTVTIAELVGAGDTQ